ncbi:hypothetical protein FQN52_008549 [Onygenales sp. PD_12]|nr:hypothetical protein FQN52_008549 [Onygenales sp. PD_12]KAK2797445.1 hypothetical protein FQN51_008478 [Onygenales sp. PD_10]
MECCSLKDTDIAITAAVYTILIILFINFCVNLHPHLSFTTTNDKRDKEVNGKLEQLETRLQNKFETLEDNFDKMLKNQTQILRRLDAVDPHTTTPSRSAAANADRTPPPGGNTSRRFGGALFENSN